MKFTLKDYRSLKRAVKMTGVDIQESLDHYKKQGIGNDPEVRFIWDLFWASRWSKSNRGNIYRDNHIETAMRKIVRELAEEQNNSSFEAMDRLMAFALNFPHDFIEQIEWTCEADHIRMKFNGYYDQSGAIEAFPRLWSELSRDNRKRLTKFIMSYEGV